MNNKYLIKINNKNVLNEIKKSGRIAWQSDILDVYLVETDKPLSFIKSIKGVISARKPIKGSFNC